jgi:hypothetical protein
VIDPVASAPSTSAAGGSTAKSDAVSRGFEQLLVQQLAKELLKTAGDTGSEYASLLPSALADAVEDGGGLGLDLDVQGTRS